MVLPSCILQYLFRGAGFEDATLFLDVEKSWFYDAMGPVLGNDMQIINIYIYIYIIKIIMYISNCDEKKSVSKDAECSET